LVVCLAVATGLILANAPRLIPPGAVVFHQSAPRIDTFDLVEIEARVPRRLTVNPFSDATFIGYFWRTGAPGDVRVDGFCDSSDGGSYRLRFMPSVPGDYRYRVEYRRGPYLSSSIGGFRVEPGRRRGPLRVDPRNRWHFLWEGTDEHCFVNGTTAYWLLGWQDERVIEAAIDRLAKLRVNRLRVTLAGRSVLHFGEPAIPGANWTSFLSPWIRSSGQKLLHYAGRVGQVLGRGFGGTVFEPLANLGDPDDLYHPGFDYSRFNVPYWQKWDRALRYARDRDVAISIVLDMGTSKVFPVGNDERRFVRYAVARFAAFSNVTWDLGDDFDLYRSDEWARATGSSIKQWDPYHHLATSHPVDNAHQDRSAPWFDFTSFQEWSRRQHAFMLSERSRQQQTGRVIPQLNEEYGYEDHYPKWSGGLGTESLDTLRRMAWEISMAGGYQTTGETARRGTNVWPDTGGGWLNGRGDDSMTMLVGYARLVDFFTSFEWWRTEPHDEFVIQGGYCLATPGKTYVFYLPTGGLLKASVAPGPYSIRWLNARTGDTSGPHQIDVGAGWTIAAPSDSSDWALLMQRSVRDLPLPNRVPRSE
jgi:hypothetical protein